MRSLLVIALSTASISLNSQEAARVTLDARSGSLSHGFSNVTSVRELPDGRLLVIDMRERSVFLADFGSQRVAPLGRTGQGPQEYSRPLHLIPLPDGRTLIQDPGNARFLEVTPKGEIRGVFPLKDARGADVGLPPRAIGLDAWGSDGLGRLYFEPYPRDAGKTIDAAIVRLDIRRGTLDTVATYSMPNRSGDYTVSSPRPKEVVVQVHVWNPRTQWSVASDGRIALAEAEPYRVAWFAAGKRINGTPVRFTPVRVTNEEREAYLDSRGRPAGAPSGERTNNPVKREGDPIFPATMPPFVGRAALLMAPDGHLWVARSKNVSNTVQRYDVFDESGRLTRIVELPPQRRVIGFGARELYVVYRDGDDLEHVERYRRPM